MTKGPDLNQLPSKKKFYDVFDSATKGKCAGTCENSVDGALKTLSYGDDFKKEICGACNKASTMSVADDPYNERYNFLYYWIWQKVLDKLNGGAFDSKMEFSMKSLCLNMKNEYKGKSYEVICTENIDKKLLLQRKKVHEYSYDYRTMDGGILMGTPNCKDEWSTYRKEVLEACRKVGEGCMVTLLNSSDSYCDDFNSKYRAHCDTLKLLELYCDEHAAWTTADKKNTEYSVANAELQAALPKVTTTASISSIFGTLGLTVAPFLLYKYKPWSSWFGNHFGHNGGRKSNKRKRRSTESTFDAFTEYTTTEGASTIGSTICDLSGENSTVRSSVNTRPSTTMNERTGRAGTGTSANNNTTTGHHQRMN
ncbi:KIR-like protein, partial [Plasmodium coatneyi]